MMNMVLKKNGKMLSWLLSFAMVLCMAPAMTLTSAADEPGPEEYGVWIGNTQVTSENADHEPDRNWTYDPDNNLLMLSDFEYVGVGYHADDAEGFYSAIYSEHDLSVQLNGYNRIIEMSEGETTKSCGIYVKGSLAFYGNESNKTGTIYVQSSENAGPGSVGIRLAAGDEGGSSSSVESGTVAVAGTTGSGIVIDENNKLTVRSQDASLIAMSVDAPTIVSPAAANFVIDGARNVVATMIPKSESAPDALTAITIQNCFRAVLSPSPSFADELIPLEAGVYETNDLSSHKLFLFQGWIDLSDAVVKVDKANKTVTATLNDEELPGDVYKLIFFTYEEIENGEHLERVGTTFPTEPGTYIATITGIEEEGFLYGARSEPFTISRSSGSARSSGGGLPAVSPVTVPVTGAGNTVGVSASISGETATVQKPTDQQMEQILKQGTETGEILMDVSGLGKVVNTAVLPAETLKTVSENANNKEVPFLRVGFTDGSMALDGNTMDVLLEKAQNRNITLSMKKMDEKGKQSLTEEQRKSLEKFNSTTLVDVNLMADNAPVHDLNGGSVSVSVKNVLLPGQNARGLTGWYLAEDGTATPVKITTDMDDAVLHLNHCSTYVIDYDEAKAAETADLSGYDDMNAGAWYAEGVGYALEKGLMKGVAEGLFAPESVITRAQMAQILHNLEGRPSYSGRIFFKDADPEAWYAPAIRWANAEGLMEGYDEDTFGTNDLLTREQLVTVLHRYGLYRQVVTRTDGDLSGFGDGAAVSPWAVDAFGWAVQSRIIEGVEGGLLAPKDSATRAQMAAILMRYCENVAE